MKPQPPVTKMRIAQRTNSAGNQARADSPPFEAWWTLAAESKWTPWIIVVLGAFLRVFLLGIKPPHFDEGINGWFVDQMVKNGYYHYDPTNYHGPLHFYILFLSQTLFGRNLWALRMPVVLGSILCIWLTTRYEPIVGRSISRWAALAMREEPLPVYGDGRNVRDWIHVEDHCAGIIAALFEGKSGMVYNFGGNNEATNFDVVKMILDRLNKPHSLISFVTDRLGHDRRYAIDASLAERELKWRPLREFRQGLESTIDWYLNNRGWWETLLERAGRYD